MARKTPSAWDGRKEAAELFERGFRIRSDFARQDPNDAGSRLALATDGIRLAGVLHRTDPPRAVSTYDEVLRRLAEVKDNSRARRGEARALARSTYPLRAMGRFQEARKRLDLAFARLSDLKLYPSEQVQPGSEPDDALRALAEFEAATGSLQHGLDIYQQLLKRIEATKPEPASNLEDAADLSNIYAAVAVLHRRAGHAKAAAEIEARRLDLWRTWDRKLPGNVFVHRQLESVR